MYHVYSEILANLQNCGSKEDSQTAILATIFKKCPELARIFYSQCLDLIPQDQRSSFLPLSNQSLETIAGYKLRNKNHAFIPCDFHPDIWIFDANADWGCREAPEPELHFLIECKEGAKVSENQRVGYSYFRDELFLGRAKVLTLLIHCNASQFDKDIFGLSLNWAEVAVMLRSGLSRIPSESKLDELFFLLGLFEHQLCFPLKELPHDRHEANLQFCRWIRKRVECQGYFDRSSSILHYSGEKYPGTWLTLAEYQSGEELFLYVDNDGERWTIFVELWNNEQRVSQHPIYSPGKGSPEEANKIMVEVLEWIRIYNVRIQNAEEAQPCI